MPAKHPHRLDRPVDVGRDHVLGNPDAEMTLLECGSYTCTYCHAAHALIADLRDRFGDGMRYVFRQLPIAGRREDAVRAAQLAEYAGETTGQFWAVHDALMRHEPTFAPNEIEQISGQFGLPPHGCRARDGVGRRRLARRRGYAERAAQRRGGDAELLHQRPPI